MNWYQLESRNDLCFTSNVTARWQVAVTFTVYFTGSLAWRFNIPNSDEMCFNFPASAD